LSQERPYGAAFTMKKVLKILLPACCLLFFLCACDMSGLSSKPARRLIKKRCFSCHTTARIYKSTRSSEEWDKIVARMIRHGAKLDTGEKSQILDYLKENYSSGRAR